MTSEIEISSDPMLISAPTFADERGVFEKKFYVNLNTLIGSGSFQIHQVNRSLNKVKGTVRGLHFQGSSFAERKIITVLNGELNDYLVDLRVDKPSYGKVWKFNLKSELNNLLFVPRFFAHGFQTLTHNTEVLYLHDNHYDADSERGVNVLDPELAINFALPISNISARDRELPFLKELKNDTSQKL